MDNLYLRNGLGPHAAFIKRQLPGWIKHSHVADLKRLAPGLWQGQVSVAEPPQWFTNAPSWLRQALMVSQARSRLAYVELAKTLKNLQGITQFAEPRLKEALHSHSASSQDMDINRNQLFYLRRNQPVQHQSLLQAALMNFEGNEAFALVVKGQVSALAPAGALPLGMTNAAQPPDIYATVADGLLHGTGPVVSMFEETLDNLKPVPGFSYREKLDMTPQVFSQICRALDLGQQYQEHLGAVFDAPGRAPLVRRQMIRAQKELLAVRLHTALMRKQVSAPAYDMLRGVLEDDPQPRLNGKPVVFSQLQLYGMTVAEVLLIGPYRSTLPVTEWQDSGFGFQVPVMKKPDMEPLVVYIPGDPVAPLKQYPSLEAFQYQLGLNLRTPQYQRLFANLMPQGEARAFLSRLNHQLYKSTPDPKGIEPAVYVDEVDLKLGQVYLDTPPGQLFDRMYSLHLQRLKANARKLAVPTADADSKLLQERLDYWLGLGLDAVNVAAFFIPGAGEVMMAVMALQLGAQIYHGFEGWAIGDAEGAWANMESVAINVALAATMSGGGYAFGKVADGSLSRWVDHLTNIVLPSGEARLWNPDLVPYQCDPLLQPHVRPNGLGQYLVDGKIYVQIDRCFYEQVFDPALNAWRIKHPADNAAYQPLLEHNQGGAWRHRHERPLQWSRETLLRRLGHETDRFDDRTLGQIGNVSGISDDALRKVHVDGLPIPAMLMDTLEQFGGGAEMGSLGKQQKLQVDWLRRRFPMLSERVAQELLEQFGHREMTPMHETRQVPPAMDDLARTLAQQSRLNRALAGLYLPAQATRDTARLARYCREHMPATALVAEGADLQRALGDFGTAHRIEMARCLKLRVPRSRPHLQKINGQTGYPLSGRAQTGGVAETLITRMRDVYPNMTDEEVISYVSSRLNEGQSDQQIFHFLMTQQRELDGLRQSLQQWIRTAREPFHQTMRQQASDRLVACWREGLYRNGEPSSYLNLEFDLDWIGEFPVLQADFSHVRTLKLDADLLMSEPDMGFVRRFTGVERLELSVECAELLGVPEGLGQLPQIKDLALSARWQGFSRTFIEQLRTVAHIERLSLTGALETLDVSGWPRLRALRVHGNLEQWPIGVLDLQHLDTLDLSGASINTLPEQLFAGHSRLWRGMHLNWSNIDPASVMKAYEFLRDNPAHLLDLSQWITDYCRGSIKQFVPHDLQFRDMVMAQYASQGQGLSELLVRVNTLHAEHRALNLALDVWIHKQPTTADMFFRRQAADRLRHCWSQGVASRLELDDVSPGPSWRRNSKGGYLDISGGGVHDLPQLPANAFGHVYCLDMSNLSVPLDELDRFLGAFTHVETLNLSHDRLTSLPVALAELRRITDLNLAFNELTFNPFMQGRLNFLRELKKLSLQGNRVSHLDVSALTRLESLDLSESGIKTWPGGALQLPQLRQLNLNRSAITQIPQAALHGHDQLMLGTHLRGCRLTPASCADLLAYAQRTGRQSAGDISPLLLASGKTGGAPEFFPDDVSDNPDLLLPAAPVLDPDQPLADPAALLLRIHPDLGLGDAIECIEQWRNQGLDALDIDARLALWNHQYDGLIQRLNSWIDTPGHREGGRWVSAVDRRRAADRVLQAWRHVRGAAATDEMGNSHSLDFSDLCLGDIAPLHASLEHVTTLNLSGIRLSAQGSDGFIREFPALNTLRLNNNRLTSLPEALGSLGNLTRLEASHNRLEGGEQLQHQLRSLARLQWLDLSYNRLDSFDLEGLSELQSLDLRGNQLTRWPARVLTSPALRSLDLSNNQIDHIPPELFDGNNDELMANTDLSDNLMSSTSFSTLRDYMEFSGNTLGFSREEIELALDDTDTAASSSDESDEDLVHPGSEPEDQQKERWFDGVADGSPKHAIWENLQAREGSEGLFHLLSQLKYTRDFIQDKADLARRVWDVLQAADADPALCRDLFIIAHSPMTCGDGRILLFSDLEVKVHEFNALRSVVAGEEGVVLLRLARSLFRLGQVEEIAAAAISLHPDLDPAEVRLAYRISLARRLDLPRQPKDMLFRNAARVSAQDIESAYARVLAAQDSPAFMERLITQEYWVNYLQRKYEADFSALEHRFELEAEALQDLYPELGEVYSQEIEALGQRKKVERRALLTRLSQRERDELEPV